MPQISRKVPGFGAITPVPQARIDALLALYRQGRFAEVVNAIEDLAPRHAPSLMLLNILGAAQIARADFAGAESAFEAAIAIDDRHAELHNNLGAALEAQDKFAAAAAAYARALVLAPDHAPAHYNRGNALRKQNAIPEAIACYERALALKPDYVEACNNLGLALRQVRDIPAAIGWFERALELDPHHAEACDNLGLAFQQVGRHQEAIGCYRRALAIRPGSLSSLHNIATALADLKDYQSAAKALDMVLAADPDNYVAIRQKAFAQIQMCDFSARRSFPPPHGDAADRALIPPFLMLALHDDPAEQLRYSRQWALASQQAHPPALPLTRPSTGAEPKARIRIGYFSADFHVHATMFLMSGLFREHDRSQFEIIAYSYGPEADDEARSELLAHVDRLVEIGALSDTDAVALARSHDLDIAVDLKGYTEHSRSQIFAGRLAPVQINYLGYPGSMGSDHIDYLIADAVIVPDHLKRFYAEKIIALPGSYQPNDDRREIAAAGYRRSDFGLPENAFVFCCFNHTYKIAPQEWAIWMRLLDRVEGSVLWLMKSNHWAEANLRAEAVRHGVDPDRLVFSEGIPHAQHLARLQLADLFLDTFAVNAHTTASDALWAGLPLVTKAGRQFAARVSASLLHALDLGDLVTTSDEAYEALILDLATDRDRLAEIRARLAANRLSHSLFDSAGYARKLERAYRAAHERQLAGLAPDDITII